MKHRLTRYVAAVTLLSILGWGASSALQAQATLAQTTLSAAVDGTSSTVKVTAAGSIVAGWVLYVDTEAMQVISISGTTVTVQRGAYGTQAQPHAVGSVLYNGPAQHFASVEKNGACTASEQLALPRINVITGSVANCVDGKWRSNNLNPIAYMTLPRTPVASGAYTALLTDVVIAYTTLAGASTVTLPSASGLSGHVIIVKNESGVNASLSGRLITIVGTIDGLSNSSISDGYGTLRLISNGVNWFSW